MENEYDEFLEDHTPICSPAKKKFQGSLTKKSRE
jgi:hypothetical protein